MDGLKRTFECSLDITKTIGLIIYIQPNSCGIIITMHPLVWHLSLQAEYAICKWQMSPQVPRICILDKITRKPPTNWSHIWSIRHNRLKNEPMTDGKMTHLSYNQEIMYGLKLHTYWQIALCPNLIGNESDPCQWQNNQDHSLTNSTYHLPIKSTMSFIFHFLHWWRRIVSWDAQSHLLTLLPLYKKEKRLIWTLKNNITLWSDMSTHSRSLIQLLNGNSNLKSNGMVTMFSHGKHTPDWMKMLPGWTNNIFNQEMMISTWKRIFMKDTLMLPTMMTQLVNRLMP